MWYRNRYFLKFLVNEIAEKLGVVIMHVELMFYGLDMIG
jgi:hypothetical protein